MVDNLLPDHVGLPRVPDLAVHLVKLMTWMGRGVGWGVGPCDYSVTPSPIGSRGAGFGTRA